MCICIHIEHMHICIYAYIYIYIDVPLSLSPSFLRPFQESLVSSMEGAACFNPQPLRKALKSTNSLTPHAASQKPARGFLMLYLIEGPTYLGLFRLLILGTVIMVLGRYLVFGFLEPWGLALAT